MTIASAPREVDIAIVGAGFSGIAMAVKLMEDGEDFVILERGPDVGGTWRDNSYPGCACDVPSHLYSFSFAPNPEWSSTFSPQPEIQAYLRKVAEDEGVRPRVRFDCPVQEAAWDTEAERWRIQTPEGEWVSRVLINAGGGLSSPSIPDIEGAETFAGAMFHSAEWDHEHDLTGERVAVIGTGASAIQFVPQIQPDVAELHLYQRTPPWIMPRRARPITTVERAVYRRFPAVQLAMRSGIYWAREAFALPMLRVRLAPIVRKLALAHIHKQVKDPVLRAKLIPDYLPGCKRILISNDYFPALAQPNVDVLTDGIAEIRPHGVVDANGVEREVDTIIFGTGFHVTDQPIAAHVRGEDGRTLAEHWSQTGMSAHRGTAVAGFPNLFFMLGPNTGLGHTSVVFMAETVAGYIRQALRYMRQTRTVAVAPRAEAQARWNAGIDRRMEGTVWMDGGCQSWYLDRNGRNTTLWPDQTFTFRRILSSFDAANYAPATAPDGAQRELAGATA